MNPEDVKPQDIDWKTFCHKLRREIRLVSRDNFNLRQSLKAQTKQHKANDRKRRRAVYEKEMGMKEKLLAAAGAAAAEATLTERARVLWILDTMVKEAQDGLSVKVSTPAMLHAMKVKLAIVVAVAEQARRQIVSGVAPPTVNPEDNGHAD